MTVTAKLETYFTVYAIDRRGRGQSGDTQPYAIVREFEDTAAMIDALSGPVYVIGHSYGALCSLEAALLTKNIHKLILYEPPVYTTIKFSYPPDAFETFDTYINAGDYQKALQMVYTIGDAPAHELEIQKALPNWQARLSATPSIRREVIGAMNYHFNPDRFRNLETPTLLLVGSESTRLCTKGCPVVELRSCRGKGMRLCLLHRSSSCVKCLAFLNEFSAVDMSIGRSSNNTFILKRTKLCTSG